MRFTEAGGSRYAQFENLSRFPRLVHAFATRPLDISPRRSADSAARDERRAKMVRDFGLDPDRLCYCIQTHKPHIATVREDSRPGAYEAQDGLITAVVQMPLMTFSADCPLVLAYDPVANVVGMVHSSWRCTVAFSTRSLIETMTEQFGSRAADIHAGIGPSAGPTAYEVQEDVWEAAATLPQRGSFFRRHDGRMYFDLWAANAAQLIDAGVPQHQVEIAGICTMTRNDLFYSFRREGKGCGHFGLLAALAGSP